VTVECEKYICTGKNILEFPLDIPENVTRIEIISTGITRFGPSTFAGFPDLTHVIINANTITEFDDRAFADSAITNLLMYGNTLSKAPVLDDLSTSLITLNLQNNALSNFPFGYFVSFDKLRNLYLDYNTLTEVPNLQHLNLTLFSAVGNRIALREGDFINTTIASLNLRANAITSTSLTHLSELADSLEMLFISDHDFSLLTAWDLLSFIQSLPRLTSLVIRSAALSTFPEPPPGRSLEIYMQDNPIVCDCRLSWVVGSDVLRGGSSLCASPNLIVGRELENLTQEDLCPGNSPT
jgi:Leucine-rich repeat (LRR) protein